MTPPPVARVLLNNYAAPGGSTALGTAVDVTPLGPITRTMGSGGDVLQVSVPIGSLPVEWDLQGEFRVTLDPEGTPLVLGGYRLRARVPTDLGRETTDTDGSDAPTHHAEILVLETHLPYYREGRGGMLMEGTLNELNENGLVDTEASTYKTTKQLADLCMGAVGIPYTACSTDINTVPDGSDIDAPGPLDWGMARPINELDALLSRVGWAMTLDNAGTLRCFRPARAGDAVSLGAFAGHAEPYLLTEAPGVRSSRIVVTSSPVRTIVVTSRNLSSLAWVHFDTRTNSWLTQADYDILYPEEPGPEDIDAFKAGVTSADLSEAAQRSVAQLFRAVGLTGLDLLDSTRFVALPSEVTTAGYESLRGATAVAKAKCCVDLGAEQFMNVPIDGADPAVRFDGVQSVSRAGVFVLPSDGVFVRVNGGAVGRRSDARMLIGDELTVTFMHESDTGVATDDYAVFGYELNTAGPTPVLGPVTDPSALLAMLEDPAVIKIHNPAIRRVVLWPEGEPEPTSLNEEVIAPYAAQLAWARVAADDLASGTVVFRGLRDISPGDLDGAVSRVQFDPIGLRTMVGINQHERPYTEFAARDRANGRSIAAGVARAWAEGSSVGSTDARVFAHNAVTGGATGTGSTAQPEAAPAQRGRDRATAATPAAGPEGAVVAAPRAREMTTILAKITGSAPIEGSYYRWKYTWEEDRVLGLDASSLDFARSSTTHGQAINLMETYNAETGVQGNGVDTANIPAGFQLVPIGSCTVRLYGPFPDPEGDGSPASDLWHFSAVNALDGECEGGGPTSIDGGAL